MNTYARKIDKTVKQVSVSLNGNFQNIEIKRRWKYIL